MKLTNAAQEMVNALGKISTFNDLAAVIATAEEIATEQGLIRIATVHIVAAMAELIANADPVAPDYIVTQKQRDSPRDREYHHCPAPTDADPMSADYDTPAAEEPTSQIKDSRDSAEAPGAQ